MAVAEAFLQEGIGRRVWRSAMLTIGCRDAREQASYQHVWDVERRGGRLFYGYSKSHYLMLISRIYWCLDTWGRLSMILWSFTERVGRASGLPVKQLRVYVLHADPSPGLVCRSEFCESSSEGGFRVEAVDIETLKWASNTDPETGKPLEPEEAVEYCYEDLCEPPSSTAREKSGWPPSL